MATSAFGEVPSDGGDSDDSKGEGEGDGSHGTLSCNKGAVLFSFHCQPPHTWLALSWGQGGKTDEGRFSAAG